MRKVKSYKLFEGLSEDMDEIINDKNTIVSINKSILDGAEMIRDFIEDIENFPNCVVKCNVVMNNNQNYIDIDKHITYLDHNISIDKSGHKYTTMSYNIEITFADASDDVDLSDDIDALEKRLKSATNVELSSVHVKKDVLYMKQKSANPKRLTKTQEYIDGYLFTSRFNSEIRISFIDKKSRYN